MSRGTTDVFMSSNGKRMLALFFAGFLVFLYLPTILLIIFSFNASTVDRLPAQLASPRTSTKRPGRTLKSRGR